MYSQNTDASDVGPYYKEDPKYRLANTTVQVSKTLVKNKTTETMVGTKDVYDKNKNLVNSKTTTVKKVNDVEEGDVRVVAQVIPNKFTPKVSYPTNPKSNSIPNQNVPSVKHPNTIKSPQQSTAKGDDPTHDKNSGATPDKQILPESPSKNYQKSKGPSTRAGNNTLKHDNGNVQK